MLGHIDVNIVFASVPTLFWPLRMMENISLKFDLLIENYFLGVLFCVCVCVCVCVCRDLILGNDAHPYIAYVMLIGAAPIPATRWHCSLQPKLTPWADWHAP